MLVGKTIREDYYFILDKLQSRLASWKGRLLKKVGRITLAQLAILLVKAPQGKPSHVWKVICKAYSTLKDGFSVRIGNEASNVWFDNWTRTEPLCTKVVYDDIQGVDLTLSNLITGGKWNLDESVKGDPTNAGFGAIFKDLQAASELGLRIILLFLDSSYAIALVKNWCNHLEL
ncbi:hypothetical protein D0Y65_009885 [Glycine soja]|uniref:Uncharacterized protein n=1 Tax=Glycine soja TaxID=3848 RepID=A0A445L0U6_GLYSO|nr:hypothetical protein D0Y65_009885 [Glycine soja]